MQGGAFFPVPAESAQAVPTFSEAISFHSHREEVRVFQAPPAHTGGDSFL